MNRYGNPKQENGKITRILSNTWCHQCKMKHQKIVVCDHFWDENRNSKCNGRYCTNCCKRHYGEDLSSLENLDNWTCYKCANKCVCAACRRLRGANHTLENSQSNPLIQKGKRKRNKVKMVDEHEEEDEEEALDDEEEEEEEFYPSVKFEKNLRSRKKTEKNSNSNNNNVTLQNSSINKKSSPPRNSTINEPKKPIPKVVNPSSSPTHSNKAKNTTIKPSENKKQKVQSPNSLSTNITPSQNPKIMIPQEDLENASNSNYMFDILLQVSTLESNEDSNVTKQNLNLVNNNIVNPFDNNLLSGNNQQNLTSFGNNLNNKLNSVVDLHQKLIKYESVQSNPLLPSSLHHIFQLRQEVSSLTNELKNMKQDFMKLHRLFESYVQTNEGSHESSPIGYGLSDALHNSQLENLVQNN